MYNAANNAWSKLAQGITADATSLTVEDASSFPEPPFVVSIDDEIIEVGSKTANTLSDLVRGVEGTTPAAHVSGVRVENRFTAGTYQGVVDGVDAVQSALDAHKDEAITRADLANNLATTEANFALDARQGKALNEKIPYNNYEYSGRELPFTWAEIKAKCQNEDWEGIRIGDYKTITLTTSEVVKMEVAGIDTYYGYASGNKHNIDFISRDCLASTYQANPTNTNEGGWLASALYETLNTTIYNTLPSDVKASIGLKRMLLENKAAAESTTWAWHDETQLWIPAELEVFGYQSWSQIGYGTGNFKQYPVFMGSERHIIKGAGNGGGAASWWLLSPRRESAANFCNVSSYGSADYSYASRALRVPLCFRVS